MMNSAYSAAQQGSHLAKIWKTFNPLPVSAAELALEYSRSIAAADPILKVREEALSGFEGLLVKRPEKQGWYILHESTVIEPGRKNFTVAHELGHYVLHRNAAERFECSQEVVLCDDAGTYQEREYEANRFASYLLMPIDDFRKQVESSPTTIEVLRGCAHRYNVSLTAATLKWLEFTLENAALVVSRDGFVLWTSASQSAQHARRFRTGTPIPRNCAAQSFRCGAVEAREGVTVAPGEWHDTLPTREFLIRSDRYDLSMSLLVFEDDVRCQTDESPTDDLYDILLSAQSTRD